MKKTSYTPTDLNEGFVVVITIEAKAGEEDAVGALLQELVAPTMAEPGVKLFQPYRSPRNPASFFIYELYVDEAAWLQHQETAHFKTIIPHLLPLIAKRERVPFVPYIA